MSATYLGYFIVALLIGCGTPVQAGINSLLGKTLGHPLLAAATNTTVATPVSYTHLTLPTIYSV